MRLPRPRLVTRQGQYVTAASALAIVSARLFGSIELFVLGVIGLILVLGAIVWVRMRRLRLDVSRTFTPPRVHAGGASEVSLTVTNRSRNVTPVVRVHDPVSGTRGANLLVAPLATDAPARAAYRLPTNRRGVIEIGPMEVQITDPFGLAQATIPAAGATRLTVYPPVHRLAGLPSTGGADPHSGFEHHRTLSRGGEDFYSLRPYVAGDDLRRVHWASTARHDELLVRQDELPWQGRMTVVLDNTAGRLDDDDLDLATSIAASILSTAHTKGNLVRLVLAGGGDSDFVSGNAQFDSLLESLATVELDTSASLRRAVDRAATNARRGGVVAVTGELEASGHAHLQRLSRSFGSVCSVIVDRSATDPDAPLPRPMASRRMLRVTRDAPFPAVWNNAMRNTKIEAPL